MPVSSLAGWNLVKTKDADWWVGAMAGSTMQKTAVTAMCLRCRGGADAHAGVGGSPWQCAGAQVHVQVLSIGKHDLVFLRAAPQKDAHQKIETRFMRPIQ